MVLTQPGHQGAVYELVGVPAISQVDVANTLGEQLNRPVTVKVMPVEEWERNARASGMGDYQVATLIKMFRYYERYGFAADLEYIELFASQATRLFYGFRQKDRNGAMK